MKVALLAYYFPPDQSVGSVRPENWANWLGERHDMVVITPRLATQASVEDNTYYRVVRPRSILLSTLEFVNQLRKKVRKKKQISSSAFNGKPKKQATGIFTYRMPCLHDLWLFSSYLELLRIKPDVVIATHGPYINLVSAWLYVFFHPKTILWTDFRDLWTENHTVTGVPGVRVLERIIEKNIIRSAQIVTSVSEHLCEKFRENFLKKAHLVYNAPASAFVGSNRSISCSGITICYAGTIYPGWRDPSTLFERIRNLVNSNVLSSKSLQLTFASRHAGNFFALVDEFDVLEFVDYRGAISREESIALQQQADILLLLESNAPEARGVLTGKVFEYLMTDKPILLVGPGPDSELYQLLQKHDRLFTLDDLERFLRGEVKTLPKGTPVDYSEISRGQLLDIMDSLMTNVGKSSRNA